MIKKIREYVFRIIKLQNYLLYRLYIKDFKLKSLLRTIKIFSRGINIGDKDIPWIPIKAKIWLDKILKPDMILYEFGSGVSTLYLSTKVKTIVSIEHNKNWFNIANKELLDKQISNCEYKLIEPDHLNARNMSKIENYYLSNLKEYKEFHFRTYVESINDYPDKYFDLVFIDGRARIGCILRSIRKIKSGGFLVLDDSDEKKYDIAKKILKKYDRRDFFGVALLNPYLSRSTISFGKATIWKIN